jgi:predicted nucleic acid-binding protein
MNVPAIVVICADASVAVKWILDEERSDRAIALYEATAKANQPIVAPPLLPLEITNILRQRMRTRDGLSLVAATQHLDDFLALPIEFHNPAELHFQALVLADALDLPANYDAHYLALAEHLGCELWTDDLRLMRRVATNLPCLRWIGDHPAPAV